MFCCRFLIVRIVYCGGIFTQSRIAVYNVTIGITIILAFTVAFLKPYKKTWCNFWSGILLIAIALMMLLSSTSYHQDAAIAVNALACLPMLYVILVVLVFAIKKIQQVHNHKHATGKQKATGGRTCTDVSEEESLPY